MIEHTQISQRKSRRGASAVEAALILPIVILITLGGIDFAQYINLGQLVSNASREAARIASRHTTTDVEEVEAAVENYLKDWYPSIAEDGFRESLKIKVMTEEEVEGETEGEFTYESKPIPSGDLTNVPSGDAVKIEVSFDYATVRWIPGPDYWKNNLQAVTTYCRRE